MRDDGGVVSLRDECCRCCDEVARPLIDGFTASKTSEPLALTGGTGALSRGIPRRRARAQQLLKAPSTALDGASGTTETKDDGGLK